MDEKRAIKRCQPIRYYKVLDRKTKNLVGRVIDLSTEGIGIITTKEIKPGNRLSLSIDMPGALNGNSKINLDAISCWSGKDVNPDYFNAGLQIKKASKIAIERLRRLCVTNVFKS